MTNYRCGNGSEFLPLPAAPRADEAPRRGHTPLHLPAFAPAATFRVVADLRRGAPALLCLGRTRGEALAAARQTYREVVGEVSTPSSAPLRGLAGQIVWLRLQRWQPGERGPGAWVDEPTRRGELPRVRLG